MGWAIAIHGGAGAILESLTDSHRAAVEEALPKLTEVGAAMLKAGACALDVVEQATVALEECELFQAGRGSVLSAAGTHELEASIMDGLTGSAGAACGLRTVRNPVCLARQILERTTHVFIAGRGAEDLAKAWDLERVPNEWFTTDRRLNQLRRHLATPERSRPYPETVGAVACDMEGRVAAATSTGGTTGKLPGRIGDAPLINAGTWADERVAVSCTGIGENFVRAGTARMVAARVELLGESIEQASVACVQSMPPESGGLIAVDCHGNVSLPFTSQGMYRGWETQAGTRGIGIGAI
ncbi:MAG: isoaspartyl peptidase/L-asparaginase [Planctomycetes bacterium]|nr:isoaspartyl peptidase/L-asparaginase [Planctomycetota bacterium]MCP4838356.1 isoaspartyl peptidase/L-asparaginase [Planctomycetota bacterium]